MANREKSILGTFAGSPSSDALAREPAVSVNVVETFSISVSPRGFSAARVAQ